MNLRKSRVRLLRVAFVCLVLMALFFGAPTRETVLLDFVCHTAGYLLLMAGLGLRLWAILYVGERKSRELITPELGDTILPGITRASIIELARDRGVNVSERKIAITEALTESSECFICGTAAGATPITSITYKGKKTVFNDGKVGEFTADIRDTIKGIQYGKLPDTKGWLVRVC